MPPRDENGASKLVERSGRRGASIRDAVAELEQRSIEAALHSVSGNKSRADKVLGISRFALQRKLDKYGLGRSADNAADDVGEGQDGEADSGVVESPSATTPEIES